MSLLELPVPHLLSEKTRPTETLLLIPHPWETPEQGLPGAEVYGKFMASTRDRWLVTITNIVLGRGQGYKTPEVPTSTHSFLPSQLSGRVCLGHMSPARGPAFPGNPPRGQWSCPHDPLEVVLGYYGALVCHLVLSPPQGARDRACVSSCISFLMGKQLNRAGKVLDAQLGTPEALLCCLTWTAGQVCCPTLLSKPGLLAPPVRAVCCLFSWSVWEC